MDLLGVNLAGAEFGSVGQAYGTGYTYPTHAEIDYYAASGMNVIRLPFLWERLQPTLNGRLTRPNSPGSTMSSAMRPARVSRSISTCIITEPTTAR